MKKTWTILCATVCSVALVGCSQETKDSIEKAKKANAEAAQKIGNDVKEKTAEQLDKASDALKKKTDDPNAVQK